MWKGIPMSKIYLKNTYFNNHSISVHLAETEKFYFIEQINCGLKTLTKISKKRKNPLSSATQKFNDKVYFIQKVIDSTQFNTSSTKNRPAKNAA